MKEGTEETEGKGQIISNINACQSIVEVVKTIDVNKTNEYMVLTQEGLFFIKIIQIKKPGNATPIFKFEFSSEEHYFQEECVKGAFEYQPRKIIALTNGSRNIRFVNRQTYKEDQALCDPIQLNVWYLLMSSTVATKLVVLILRYLFYKQSTINKMA